MKAALRRKLAIVWALTTRPAPDAPIPRPHNRYVARGFDGGPGWGVFDRLRERYLSDREVQKLDDDALRTASVTH